MSHVKRQTFLIYLGTDHGGYELKEQIKRKLQTAKLPFKDLGAHQHDPTDDYPLIAAQVARAVSRSSQHRGVLLCRSGVGVNIVANKTKNIRAVQAADVWTAERARRDEDANILSLPADRLSTKDAWKIIRVWLSAPFRNSARDRRRLRQIQSIERAKA